MCINFLPGHSEQEQFIQAYCFFSSLTESGIRFTDSHESQDLPPLADLEVKIDMLDIGASQGNCLTA